MKQHSSEPPKYSIRFPLVVKLIGIISLIILVAMALVTGLATWFFSEDSRVRVEEQNLTLSGLLAEQVETEIRGVHSGALTLLDGLRVAGQAAALQQSMIDGFFLRRPEIAFVGLAKGFRSVNPRFLQRYDLQEQAVQHAVDAAAAQMERSLAGDTVLRSAAVQLGVPSAILTVPYRDFGEEDALIVVFSSERLQSVVQTGTVNTVYVIGDDGEVIAHPDDDLVLLGASLTSNPLVAAALTGETEVMQLQYQLDGREAFGAFRRIPFGRLAVLSSMPGDIVKEAALSVVRQNLYLTGIVLLLSILAVWFFSETVSSPVMALMQGVERIKAGDYELDLQVSTRDEIGQLTESFVEMGKGLAERERIKDSFGKFVNKEVADQALRGDLVLGGSRKTATIFFSDIRSFTAISEKLDPEAVVEFLNEYMTLMVDCVERTEGVVDKFIGDAIMAVWGAPVTRGSVKADALQAVKASLMMRKQLYLFNKNRGGVDKPIIRIGCGLNTGECLAGQIGSAQRMEYTVIGDAVNLASRIEALNKPLGTDILISENMYCLLKKNLIVEEMPSIKVKGKTDPLRIYALINLKGVRGPQTLPELRRILGLRAPAGPVDLEKEEVKYEILPD